MRCIVIRRARPRAAAAARAAKSRAASRRSRSVFPRPARRAKKCRRRSRAPENKFLACQEPSQILACGSVHTQHASDPRDDKLRPRLQSGQKSQIAVRVRMPNQLPIFEVVVDKSGRKNMALARVRDRRAHCHARFGKQPACRLPPNAMRTGRSFGCSCPRHINRLRAPSPPVI
jgi:hypothetical protein